MVALVNQVRPPAVRWTEKRKDYLARLRRKGLRLHQIADRFTRLLGHRVSQRTVRAACERFGIKAPRYDEWLPARIRSLKPLGLSDLAIATRLGVSQEAVSRHRRLAGIPSDVRSRALVRRHAKTLANERAGWPKDVNTRQARVLQALFELGGEATMPELLLPLGLNRSYLSSVLCELAAKGHVLASGNARSRVYRLDAGVEARHDGVVTVCVRDLPADPCPFPPGHPEKVEWMRRRNLRREHIHHPLDAKPSRPRTDAIRYLVPGEDELVGAA